MAVMGIAAPEISVGPPVFGKVVDLEE